MKLLLALFASLCVLCGKSFSADAPPIRVLVWDEQQAAQKSAYDGGFLGDTIAAYLAKQPGLKVTSVNFAMPNQGLSDAELDAAQVIVWWGHQKHGLVESARVEAVVKRVLDGRLALVALHSAHWARPFVRLMQERAELMSANKEELYALMKKRGDKEEQYMEARRRRVDEDQRQLEAQRVQDLNNYRSDFFGRLRSVLSARPDVRIVGDRFVFQSEIFFGSGGADMESAGKDELDKLAGALIELERTIPPDINWVARIDGHTDKRPLSGGGQFKDNWELSAARAIAVVRYLNSKGVSPQRLVAAGFGEFAPLDFGDTPEALARNRRLELKLTER